MINLYVMNVSPFEDSSLFSKGLSLIDKERLEKVNKLKKQDVKNLSLGAGLLLMFGLNYGLVLEEAKQEIPSYGELEAKELVEYLMQMESPRQFQYTYSVHGKPYLAGENPIYFSLSHSGDYVLLAVGDKEVGADIQIQKDVNFGSLAKQFMTEQEYEAWSREDIINQKELFFQIWAGKEAYLKLTGEGMTAGLQTVQFDEEKQTMVDLREEKEVQTWWGSLEGYQMAVCQFK